MNPQPGRRQQGPLAPHPELWAWLEQGPKLRAILEDFYAVALVDPRLAPFFHGVTRERIVDKQYSFLAQIFSGTRLYFGDRPRNAHHWMVISDELFDYREQLFADALDRAQAPAALREHWLEVHQVFRKQIVKAAAFPRRMAGVDLPLDGWRTEALLAGTMCDGCEGVLDVGMTASSHRRTGRTLCVACFEREAG
ncbi:MAG: group I truncated hemoglobin [Myxococcota bacterium]